MAFNFSKADLLVILGGSGTEANYEVRCTGVEIDSRRVASDSLFVALQGERTHGHAFLDAAFAAGGGLAIVEDATLLDHPQHGDRLVAVPDSVAALQQLAAHYRGALQMPVIGITGSMGKTTTKELVAALLRGASARITSSQKSFNNHLGVPLTILNARDDDDCLVLEMGMNHAGELRLLSQIARPSIVVITVIAPVHLEFFKSIDAIADAKLEILEGLTAGGQTIANADDPVLLRAFERVAEQPTHTFGLSAAATLRVAEVESRGMDGIAFTLEGDSGRHVFSLPVPGVHNAGLAAAALLAARLAYPALTDNAAATALKNFVPAPMRLNVVTLTDGRVILDDSYNANPQAMRSSLTILGEERSRGKRIAALLGEMRELGPDAERLHRELGQFLSSLGLAALAVVGEAGRHYLVNGADTESARCFLTPEDAADWLHEQQFDVALVKASRAAGLDRAVTRMKETSCARLQAD